jgi:predicted nucleic acid-binding protein
MTVVSNTTPLNYLILIGRADILSKLYEQVVIPEAVFNELTTPSTPGLVRQWIAKSPTWLIVQPAPPAIAGEMQEIQIGERQAISLARAIRADLVLLDDRRARQIAKHRGVNVVGTLGILMGAAEPEQGLTNLSEAIDDLKQTNFRASPELLESLLNRER